MLWAIDVGNTQTVLGIWSTENGWSPVWRIGTRLALTEDELAAELVALCQLDGVQFKADKVIVASVVPALDRVISTFSTKFLGVNASFLRSGDQVNLEIAYEPKTAVGADRIANSLGALATYEPPLIIVDFGTATTFDAISGDGIYLGGAILPGVEISMEALVNRTAKLPQIELEAPDSAIGKTTAESLKSGIMLGYAGAIDSLAAQIQYELGGGKVLATGGLAGSFMGLARSLEKHEPNLTLDGLRIAAPML